MLDEDQVAKLQGHQVVDPEGTAVGKISELYLSSADDRPAWAVVVADGRRVAVPLDGAEVEGEQVTVRYPADAIAGAPSHRGDHLAPESEQELYDHYGIHDSVMREDTGRSADLPG
ncbi:MAG: PRC-barrel domain-containing protein [Solirubrobacteraceae bacterium]